MGLIQFARSLSPFHSQAAGGALRECLWERGRAALKSKAWGVGLLSIALAAPASATWSIVVLNRLTGEVAVATSTCIQSFDISRAVPLIRVGEGAAAAQSFVLNAATNRKKIFDNLPRGATPQELLDFIEATDGGYALRQFGIVSFAGPPATHTGTQNGDFANGITGTFGDFEYAIQGNVLTGNNVILDCEAAFISTPGDLGQRMIAAMEAGRDAGGDGRCSCSSGAPTSCGSPPASFNYASYNAFMAVARLGDTDRPCSSSGCARGDYYLRLNYVGNQNNPEPIGALRLQYDTWRAALVGVADAALSEVTVGARQLQADGVTSTRIEVSLVDIDGVPLATGGQALSVVPVTGDAVATFQNFVDNGDGTHSIEMVSTLTEGAGTFAVVVDGGPRPVQLYPPLELTSLAPSELHLGSAEYSSSAGMSLSLYVDRGAADAGTPYRIFGSLSGTSPGQLFGGVLLPLNADRLFAFTAMSGGGLPFLGNVGTLDQDGRAEAALVLTPGALTTVIGSTLSFSALIGGTSATPAASVPVVL